jgi:hypothetical protein
MLFLGCAITPISAILKRHATAWAVRSANFRIQDAVTEALAISRRYLLIALICRPGHARTIRIHATNTVSSTESVTTDSAVEITTTALERATKVWYCWASTKTGTPHGRAACMTATAGSMPSSSKT